jgi:hypothetical protein
MGRLRRTKTRRGGEPAAYMDGLTNPTATPPLVLLRSWLKLRSAAASVLLGPQVDGAHNCSSQSLTTAPEALYPFGLKSLSVLLTAAAEHQQLVRLEKFVSPQIVLIASTMSAVRTS